MTVCGGYFLVKPADRPDYVSGDLLPPRLLSLSSCICDFIPDVWAIDWANVSPEERTAEAHKVGIEAAQLPELIDWTTQQLNAGEFGWPCVFFGVHDARAFAERFLPRDVDVRLLGIGLHPSFTEEFLTAMEPGPSMGLPGISVATRT